MTTHEQQTLGEAARALAAAQGVLSIAASVDQSPVAAPGLAGLFDSVGPSAEFMATKLTDAGITVEELAFVKSKINDAIVNKDMATINKIAKIAVTVLGTVKDILV